MKPGGDGSRPHLSIVSPIYLGEKTVAELVRRLVAAVTPITSSFEIILVEDHSPDRSWHAIEEICRQEPRVRGLKLSRNFGQHRAISAGLFAVRGEWVVVMDCDLQDLPEEIPRLYEATRQGAEIVLALREDRSDGFLKRLSSHLFYRTLSYLTGVVQDARVANFGIYSGRVIDVLRHQMPESIRYFPMMIRWVGFPLTTVPVAHGASGRGKSSYTFGKLLDLAINVMITFSEKPLLLMIRLGVLITVLSFVGVLYVLVAWLLGRIEVVGWASLIASIWLAAGIIISLLGVVGLYTGKIFDEVKKRPLFLVEREENANRPLCDRARRECEPSFT